jgi:hypothetical protein
MLDNYLSILFQEKLLCFKLKQRFKFSYSQGNLGFPSTDYHVKEQRTEDRETEEGN